MLLISSDELISSPARSPEHAGTGGGVAAAPAAAPATRAACLLNKYIANLRKSHAVSH